ncbi:zinc finger, CCHC-type containing protein [Tanacetum coccineum]
MERLGAYDMLQELKTIFSQQAAGYSSDRESFTRASKKKEYDGFVQNYNVYGIGKTVNEMHAMLKLHEETLPKKDAQPVLHAIRAGRIQKKDKNKKPQKAAKGKDQGKWKTKLAYAPNPKIPPPPKKDNPVKDAICHGCYEICHWIRNFPKYLAELMKKKKLAQGASTSGALNIYVGNGHRATVEAIRSLYLCLPSGLVIVLDNCHYAPSITIGIILVSRLYDNGFVNSFENNGISLSKDNLFYFHVIPHDGIYEIDMHCSNTNDSSVYAMSNKRAKLNLESAFLWHCRLRHINKKHIKKLQHNGVLKSTEDESFDKCVSCLFGKMARYPKETMGYSFYYPPENKVIVPRKSEFFENSRMTQEESGSLEDLELIQEEDKHHFKNTSLHHDEDDQEID